MNAPAFTPGPWHAKHGAHTANTYIWAADGLIASATRETDASLIAAAPDLYAACRAALRLAWEVGSETEDGVKTLLNDSRGDLYRQLSAALARAESQS